MLKLFIWLQSFYEGFKKSKENILAFTCGDVMLFTFLGIPPQIQDLGWKMFSTVLLAMLGGAAGMIGKDIAVWLKKTLWPTIIRRIHTLWKK